MGFKLNLYINHIEWISIPIKCTRVSSSGSSFLDVRPNKVIEDVINQIFQNTLSGLLMALFPADKFPEKKKLP